MITIWNKTFIGMALWGLTNAHLQKTDIVLEIGSGGGTLINYLAKNNYAKQIYGADISKAAIQKATKLNKDFIGSNKVSLVQAEAERLPFSKDMFHKIFAVQTHMYWTNLESASAKILALLTENGEFNIICEKDKIFYHLPQYVDKQTMTDMLKKVGFSEVDIFETNNWIHYRCVKGK
ncbi:class I SAM-dependent methyltransferase [Candidatus Enterococcus huntleyi]|uniref:class I SAM-dependent methyltransferase n=1 Tax=Candidatus Enterococcus huntleyi TaxID=1857217 RepID=UPI00137B8B97|nr:class I SAM-dependent methyltransferase [Enterococcus sp. JM4C]